MKLVGESVGDGKEQYRVEGRSEGWMRLLEQATVTKAAKRGSMRQLAVCGRRERTKISH